MKKKVLSLNNALRELSDHEPRKQYKSVDELGVRQKRRLKRARSTSCKASLGWLDEEGYTPISIQVFNNSTKQVEQIELEKVSWPTLICLSFSTSLILFPWTTTWVVIGNSLRP